MNTLLHNEEQGTPNMMFKEWRVNSIIVSAQFWPQFKTETLELPENIAKGLEAYTKAFEAVKGNRTLVWKPHLGSTNIDLEIGDKKINLTVSPIHAAIIYQFQVKVILKLITFKRGCGQIFILLWYRKKCVLILCFKMKFYNISDYTSHKRGFWVPNWRFNRVLMEGSPNYTVHRSK